MNRTWKRIPVFRFRYQHFLKNISSLLLAIFFINFIIYLIYNTTKQYLSCVCMKRRQACGLPYLLQVDDRRPDNRLGLVNSRSLPGGLVRSRSWQISPTLCLIAGWDSGDHPDTWTASKKSRRTTGPVRRFFVALRVEKTGHAEKEKLEGKPQFVSLLGDSGLQSQKDLN